MHIGEYNSLGTDVEVAAGPSRNGLTNFPIQIILSETND